MGIAIKLNNTTLAEVDSVQSIECLQQIVCEKLVSISWKILKSLIIDFLYPFSYHLATLHRTSVRKSSTSRRMAAR